MSPRTLTAFLIAIAISLTTQTAFAQAVTTPPVANNDTATTPVNTAVLIPVLANDIAASGNPIDPKKVRVERKPSNGVATALQNGQIRYTPKTGFTGPDSFTYTVQGVRGPKSNVATVTVNVQPANSAPTANAGPDQNAVTGQPVTLDGSGSSDPNGNTLTFSWQFLSVAPGSALTNADIVNPTTPSPSFTPDVDGAYTLELLVSDGTLSDTDTVVITAATPNAAPTANAGPDQNAVTGQPVTLDGSGSSDPNSNTITFSWQFLSAPLGSNLTNADIVNPTTPAPSFTPDVDGAYELELTVTDVPGGLSDTDTVIITATSANVAPNADAGPDQTAEVNQVVNLDGSNSSDPDNGPNPLTFQWVFATVAPGSALTNADIVNPTSPQASFTPDVTGVYTLTLTVSDGDLNDSDDVAINVTPVNVPPNADAGTDVLVQLGEVATLDGSNSSDPDNFPSPLTFQWSFVSVAAGSALTNADIVNATTSAPSFTPDQPGLYTLQLLVSDGSASDTDEVMVKANAAPVAVDDVYDVDEDDTLTVAAPGVLTNDTDANNDALTAVLDTGPSDAASFTLNPDGSFDYTPNPGFSGDDSFTYHANDDGANGGNGADSNVATVTITVNEVNDAPVAVDDGGAAYTTNEDGGAFAGPSVLTNDTDEENDPLTAVLDTGPTNASAFTLNPDGTFSYTPNPDFFGDDTFTYHATDGNTPNPDSNVATVTITVNAVNDAPSFTGGGDRTVGEDAGPQSGAWASGISAGPPNESGQTVSFLVSNNNNALFTAQPTVSASGVLSFTTASNANGSATVTVSLQDSGGTANGGVDTSSPAQTFTITVTPLNDAPVAAPKSFAAQANMKIVGLTGFLTGVTDADTGTGSPACVPTPFTLVSASATTPAGGTVTITNASTGTVDFDPPPGVTGNVTFTYTVSDNGCPGSATSGAATATVTVAGPVIWFVNSTVAAGGNGTLSNPFQLLASADAVDAATHGIFLYEGTYTTGLVLNSSEKLIGQGVTGTTFDTLFGIGPPPGTIARPTFTGTRPSVGGTVTVGANSVVRGLNINSTTVTGLAGGAVTGVSVSEASVTSTTGTAVNLNGTGGTVSLTSVSANGAANGIVLNGTSGPFTVLSTGTAGSGGTIQNTTGPGILLSNATGISLTRMLIQNSLDDGIRGTTVTGFTLANSTVQNNGNAIGSGNAGDNGLDFINLLGTASISSSTIRTSFHNNIIIRNSTGVLSGLTVTGATINNNVSTTDGDGFLFEAGGTANMSVNVSGSTFSAHQGDHFQAAALNSGVLNVIFSGNTLSGGHAAPLGQGITINASTGPPGYLGSVSYDLAGNTINGAISNAIAVAQGTSAATASFTGKIRNNIIGTSGVALSCSTQAAGVYVDARGNGTFTSAVTGNTIRQCFDRGILSEAGDGDSVLNLTVTGNTIDQQVGTLTREAIQTNYGITSTNVFSNVDTNVVCLNLSGNTFSHGAGAPDDFRLRKRFEATVRLPGYAGGTGQDATSLGQVVAFIQGQNTGSAGEPGSASASGTGGGYTGGAACPLPP